MSRKEKLEAMLAEDPKDTFLRYTLAMEYAGEEMHDRSLELYSELMSENYVPAFFMAGQQLASLQRNDEARDVIKKGIVQATEQKDMHAAGEMKEFLAAIDE